jgi:hypothetical protein
MYANGEVPLSALIHVQNNIWLPAGTLARWNWVVQQGFAKYGVTLRITGQYSSAWNTWNGYRPLSAQILYKKEYGNLAATPRLSSHGGTYRGQEVFAIDVDNWRDLAPGNESLAWARFVALMRLAGLTVDFVTPREQWHVGDFNNPWAVPAFASGGGGSHINPTPKESDVSEDIYVKFGKKGGQPVKAGAKANIHISDAKDITVARGAAKHVVGNLAFTLSGGKPYTSAVQITPVVRTYKDGKEVERISLRARETIFTGGDTLGEVAVNTALQANQRLSFEIGGSSADFVFKTAEFRGAKLT